MQSKQKKISILGSGPIGLFCAFFALKSGYSAQIITKPHGKNHDCAGLAAGGMLAPTYEFFEEEDKEFVDFAFSARKLWDDVAKILDFEINTHTIAPFEIAKSNEKQDKLEEFIRRRSLAENSLAIDIRGSNFEAKQLNDDGLINPRLVHDLLVQYLKDKGVIFVFDEVISYGDGQIKTKSQEIEYEILIVAAGIGSKAFFDANKELGALIPVRGQIVEIARESPIAGAVRMGKLYALQRGNNTIIGATSIRGDNDWDVRASDTRQLLNAPHELPEGFEIENAIAAYAGVRPSSIDDYPIVGPSSLQNIYLCTATYRNGWLLAPKIGKEMIELIQNGKSNFPASFNPKRYQK